MKEKQQKLKERGEKERKEREREERAVNGYILKKKTLKTHCCCF